MVNRHVFKSSKGQKLHSRDCYDLKKCKTEIKCYDKDDVYGPLCNKCFDTCMICLSVPGWTTCNEHSVCDTCFMNYIQESSSYFDFCCPCGKKGLDPRNFSYNALMTLYDSRDKKVVKKNIIEEYVNILNEKCPGCNQVFYDFDACVALYCPCGTYFCGFCFEILEDMDSAHDHVQRCPKNPCDGDLFINIEDWGKTRQKIKNSEKKKFYKDLTKNGIIDYVYYWIKLFKFNYFLQNIMFLRFIIYCFLS